MTHVINPSAESKLRTVFKLSADEQLPDNVAAAYWVAKAACDRLGKPFGDAEIVAIALVCQSPPPDKPTPLESVKSAKLVPGSTVSVVWRGEVVAATFVRYQGKAVIVEIDGVDRTIDPKNVKLE